MDAPTAQARNADVVGTILAAMPEFSGAGNSTSWNDSTICIWNTTDMLRTTWTRSRVPTWCVPGKLRRRARDTCQTKRRRAGTVHANTSKKMPTLRDLCGRQPTYAGSACRTQNWKSQHIKLKTLHPLNPHERNLFLLSSRFRIALFSDLREPTRMNGYQTLCTGDSSVLTINNHNQLLIPVVVGRNRTRVQFHHAFLALQCKLL